MRLEQTTLIATPKKVAYPMACSVEAVIIFVLSNNKRNTISISVNVCPHQLRTVAIHNRGGPQLYELHCLYRRERISRSDILHRAIC